jgi:hypothetical protein
MLLLQERGKSILEFLGVAPLVVIFMRMKALLVLLLAAPVQAELTVEVDPRIELAGVLQFLAPESSDPVDYRRPGGTYGAQLQRFEKYKDHPAVRALSTPVFAKLSFAERAELMLRLSPPPGLRIRHMLPNVLMDKAGGRDAFAEWLREVRDFVDVTDFASLDSVALLEKALGPARRSTRKRKYHSRIEAYAGLDYHGRQRLLLSPFLAKEAFGNVLLRGPRGWDIGSYTGLEAGLGTRKDYWGEGISQGLWHEAGHGLLDDLAPLWALDVTARQAKDFKPSSCYGGWAQCVKEHLVNAVESRVAVQAFGEDDGAEKKAAHFPYLLQMTARLEQYEKARAQYPTLAHFYSELLAELPPAKHKITATERLGDVAKAYKEIRTAKAVSVMLDKALALGPSTELSRRRALVRALLGEKAGALADAKAAGDAELVTALRAYFSE